jgi:ABC-2 type transport system permease protein
VNGTVLRQALHQARRTIAVTAVASGAFSYLVLLASSSFLSSTRNGFGQFLQNPPKAISAFLGGSANFFTPAGWLSASMNHPVTLALLTASVVSVGAGAVAAEIERGTIDLVLARPVPRTRFLVAKAMAALLALTAVEAGGFLGVLVARATISRMRQLGILALLRAFAGSWLLFAAFGMVAILASARTSLRGRAVGAAVGVVVGAFFLNFIALLIDGISALRFLSPFHYVDTGKLMAGEGLWRLAVPGAIALAALVLAVMTFSRRDLTH